MDFGVPELGRTCDTLNEVEANARMKTWTVGRNFVTGVFDLGPGPAENRTRRTNGDTTYSCKFGSQNYTKVGTDSLKLGDEAGSTEAEVRQREIELKRR